MNKKSKILTIFIVALAIFIINLISINSYKNTFTNINNNPQQNILYKQHSKENELSSKSLDGDYISVREKIPPHQTGYKQAEILLSINNSYDDMTLVGLVVAANLNPIHAKIDEGIDGFGDKHIKMSGLNDGYNMLEYIVFYTYGNNEETHTEDFTSSSSYVYIKHQTSPGVIAASVIVPLVVLTGLGLSFYFYKKNKNK